MATLFGLDIAEIVNTALTDAGGLQPVSLTRMAEPEVNANNLTNNPQNKAIVLIQGGFSAGFSAGFRTTGTPSRDLNFSGQGFKETRLLQLDDSTALTNVTVISILGQSTFPEVPMVGDQVSIDGEVFVLNELMESDPAQALFAFSATGGSK